MVNLLTSTPGEENVAGDFREWLEDLDFGKFAELFVENDIDLAILPALSDGDAFRRAARH